MGYKTILVHVDPAPSRRARLDLAFALAEKYDAHLVGCFALAALVVPPVPEGAPALLETLMDQRRAAAERAAAEFHDKMKKEQYSAKSEWHASVDDGFLEIKNRANYADLLIAGQPEPQGDGVPPWFAEELVLAVGRPVLYVPHAGHFYECGNRVLVGWNGSREAARAVEDAVPFLRSAQATEVLTFDDDSDVPDPDIGAHLARHDARTSVAVRPTGGIGVGAAILSHAADTGSDLIVMGAYSHSRVRELVLGGATRKLFKSMTVPTLMSH
jgi:nucleotide-binding universal stress UspA family protein